MLKFICTKNELHSLFEKYWKVGESKKFVHTERDIQLEYKIKSSSKLVNLIKENGYAYIEQPSYSCEICNEPHKFYTRKDFKSFISEIAHICIKCKDDKFLLQSMRFDKIDLHFNKKFKTLFDENLYGKNKILVSDIIKDLSFLELVYIYVIIDKLDLNINGKIGALKCASFLHEEFYKKNNILISLVQKNLLFFSANFFIINYLKYLHEKGVIIDRYFFKKDYFLSQVVRMGNIKTFNILLKPYRTSFLKYKEILINRIDEYKFSVSDIEELKEFLEQKRNQEIIFLSEAIEYNNEIKLLFDNGVLSKINEMMDKGNLKNVYGYLNHSVNSALFVLDSMDDCKRFLLKNRIFSNIFKSNKEHNVYEKSLPKNYRKSNFIKFLEEYYELDCIWEEVPVDVFIKQLIRKLDSLGKLN